jgi:hypothetical protein
MTVTQDELQETARSLYIRDERIQGQAVERLSAAGEPAIGPLLQILQELDRLPNEPPSQDAPAPKAPGTLLRAGELAATALSAIGEPAIPALRDLLKSDHLRVKEMAIAALREMQSDQALEALRDLVYQEVERLRVEQRKWWFQKLGRYLLLIAISLWLQMQFRVNVWIFWVVFGGFGGLEFIDRNAKIRQSAVDALTRSEDVRLIGVLAVCLQDQDPMVSYAAGQALKKLLRQVKASDKQYIRPREMDALIRALDLKDLPLTLAILKALEQIGDERALPKVEKLAVSSDPKIAEAARECLPFLQERAERARQAQTLLRPASAADAVPTADLLRPAQNSVPQTDPSELLRVET